MLKSIDTGELKLGMAIHDLDCGWMAHPFVRGRFVIRAHAEIDMIRKAGIRSGGRLRKRKIKHAKPVAAAVAA